MAELVGADTKAAVGAVARVGPYHAATDAGGADPSWTEQARHAGTWVSERAEGTEEVQRLRTLSFWRDAVEPHYHRRSKAHHHCTGRTVILLPDLATVA